ncbi:MAG: flippase [Bacteroidota bacterium]
MRKNFIYTISLSITNILFPIISFPYASRMLGPAGIGKVQFIVSLAQYFALFAALGIPIYGITQAAKYKDDQKKLAIVFGEISSFFLIASIVVSAIYLTIIYTVPYFAQDRHLFLAGGSLILLGFCYSDWYYSGIEEFRIILVRSVLVKLICLALLYSLVKNEGDFGKYFFITVFSILGNQVISFWAIAVKTRFRFSDLNLKQHIKPLFYIFSAAIAASIYTTLDTVMLGFLADDHAVGLYTACIKLIRLTIPFVTAMGAILIPAISRNFAQKNLTEVSLLLDNSFRFLVFFAVPASAGIALLAPEFITLFSGSRFANAASSMQILAWLPLLIGFGHFFSFQILIPAGKNREMLFSMLAGVATFLLMNFLLVPTLHEKGASLATIATELVVTLSYFYFIQKHFSFTYYWKFLIQSIACTLVFIPVIILVREWDLGAIVTLCISISLCVGLYLAAHLFLFKNTFLLNFIQPFRAKFKAFQWNKSREND